ncbi:Carboxylesterase [Bertholletia excelsa]
MTFDLTSVAFLPLLAGIVPRKNSENFIEILVAYRPTISTSLWLHHQAIYCKVSNTMFTTGGDLANVLLCSHLPARSWDAISELYKETNRNDPNFSIKYKFFPLPRNGMILSFVSSPPCTAQHLQGAHRDLVSSVDRRENFRLFEFVSTKDNPSFFLHNAAVDLFYSHRDELSLLKDQCCNISPLIITGHSIGGSIASLFTLWLLDSIFPKATTRPLCITFGSPLIGDNSLQQAISERPIWNSCFLHVASIEDPILKLFALPQAFELISFARSSYKPFGTFLLCSQSGCTCFEEPEAVLGFMAAVCSDSESQGSNDGSQIINYGRILERLTGEAINWLISCPGGWDGASPLQAGIFSQIASIKVDLTQDVSGEINSLITNIERQTKDLVNRKRNAFDPSKKLNDMKICMAEIEWYKKYAEPYGGYYGTFRNVHNRPRERIVLRKNILAQYWKKMVMESDKMPQREGVFVRSKWLFGGTNYRRLAEPLDIAEWYGKGNRNYEEERSEHYKLLEKWEKEAKLERQGGNANERDRACSLTEDSCFWAKVEEAVFACKLLKGEEIYVGDREELVQGLVGFETYVMGLINNKKVSAEIFLERSFFMEWWKDYDRIKGNWYHSSLARFMRDKEYKRYA